jgi:hypothetical protein
VRTARRKREVQRRAKINRRRSERSRGRLEKPREKIGEVAAPDGPTVVAGGEGPFVADAGGGEFGDEFFVAGVQAVVAAAGEPEEAELRVGGGRVGEEDLGDGFVGRDAAEGTDVGEAVEVAKAVWGAYHTDKIHWYVPADLEAYDLVVTQHPEQIRDGILAAGGLFSQGSEAP